MALKKKKLKKGAKVSSVKTKKSSKISKSSTKASKKVKPAKGGKVKGAVTAVGGILDRAMGAYTGSTVSEIKADFSGSSKKAKGTGRHRRGVVPKTVRKWAGKITRRRKQEEKIVKKLFGAEGGKIVKKPKSRYGSPGVITRAEAMEAMRR